MLDRVAELTVGPRPLGKKSKKRRGHRKGTAANVHHAHQRPVDPKTDPVKQAAALVSILFEVSTPTKKADEAQSRLFQFLYNDVDRINYVAFRARGYQIGSGAMESLHRTGSQLRLKLPGAKWLQHTSQAIFNIRMMRLVGNWDHFWTQCLRASAYPDRQLPELAIVTYLPHGNGQSLDTPIRNRCGK